MSSKTSLGKSAGLRPTPHERGFGPISVTAVLLGLLASCNPAPRYAKPVLQTPAGFKEAIPADYKEGDGWKLAQPGDDKIRANWWEIYGDPQLNALEQQVAESNQNVLVAEANYRTARALLVSARSQLYPTITASPAYTNSRFSQTSKGAHVIGGGTATTTSTTSTSTTGGSGLTSGTGTTGATGGSSGSSSSSGTSSAGSSSTGLINDFALPFEASYTVDLWHRVRNTVAANAYSAQATAGDVATAVLSNQAMLAQDYFQVRALDAEQQVLDTTVASYRQSLELTKVLFSTGIDSDETVSLAQTELDTAIAQQTDLGVNRAQFEHAIAVLIGKPPAAFSLTPAEFRPVPPAVPVAVASELLERRPDIAADERRVAAANAQIGVARAAYYPVLTLSASTGLESATVGQLFQWPSRFWSLGPQVSGLLLDVGARRAVNEEAQAAYDLSVANYRQTVLTVFQAVEDNLAALRILNKEVGEQHTAVQSASHTLDLTVSLFRSGIDSYLNVISAQTTVLANRLTEVQIQLRQMTSSVALVLAMGGGWDNSQLPKIEELAKKPPKNVSKNALAPASGPQGQPNPPAATPTAVTPASLTGQP